MQNRRTVGNDRDEVALTCKAVDVFWIFGYRQAGLRDPWAMYFYYHSMIM